MSQLTDYLENELLDHFLGTGAFTSPAQVYVGLFFVMPTDAGGGTECDDANYDRLAATFSAASGGATSNTSDLVFADAALAYSSDVVGIGVFDAATVGNLLCYGDLSTPKTIGAGDAFRLKTGDLDISLD